MLSVIDVHRRLGVREVLKGVTFELPEGSITGLIGPSGGGKSTLLKIIAGVARLDGGSVNHGHDQVGLMFQEGALFDSLSVYDNVAFTLVGGRVPCAALHREELEPVHSKVEAILDHVGLAKAAHKYPAQLSDGMRKRVSLARALVSEPKLVLLDDPTAGLDPVASSVIMNLILEIQSEYKPTMLIVSHDLRRLLPSVQSIIALMDGSVRFHGPLAELESQECSELAHFVASRYSFAPEMIHPH